MIGVVDKVYRCGCYWIRRRGRGETLVVCDRHFRDVEHAIRLYRARRRRRRA